jgi:hypothetical protein
MRHISNRRARQMARRRELQRRTHVPESCPRCHREPAVDTHELVRRSQSSTSAVDVFCMVNLGRECHGWVSTHPKEAVEQGWAVWRWQWEREPIDDSCTTGVYSEAVTEKRVISFRTTAAADALVAEMAARLEVDRTLVLRTMLSVASAHMDEVEKRVRLAAEVR